MGSHLILVPYLGGKQFLIDRLLPMISQHRIYVEVFGGAASLLLNKPRSKIEVYNDADGDLVAMLLAIRNDGERFQSLVESTPFSRKLYEEWTHDFIQGKKPEDTVDAAARYYYVLSACFSGQFNGGWKFQRQRAEVDCFRNRCKKIPALTDRFRNVMIDCLDFRRCIQNWDGPDTFFFLDPPYYEIKRHGYRHMFSPQDHVDLANLLGSVKGKWLVTYGNHQRIREMYKGFHQSVEDTSMASRAITRKTPEEDTERPQLSNLIISNYDPAVSCTTGD